MGVILDGPRPAAQPARVHRGGESARGTATPAGGGARRHPRRRRARLGAAVTMPRTRQPTPGRSRSRRSARIVHERFVDDEIGRLLERLAPLEESLRVRLRRGEPDPRHAPRLGEGPPRPHGAAGRDDARRLPRPRRVGRGAHEERRLRLVPPVPAGERRAEAALRRMLRVVRLALHAAARRLRARHADDRGARGVRGPAPRAHRARPHRARGRRLVPDGTSRQTTQRALRRARASPRSGSRRAPGGSTRPRIRSAPRSRTATCG